MGEAHFTGNDALAGRDVSVLPTFPAWQMLVIAGVLSWISFSRFIFLTIRARSLLQPYVAKHVEDSVPFLLWLQGVHNPTLDLILSSLSFTVSVEFYTAFLPLIIWSGHVKLGMHMVLLMTVCLYAGNCLKDTISAPRPPSPVRKLLATNAETESAQEYGLPSSHTINSLCMTGFLLQYLAENGSPSFWPVASLAGVFIIGVVYGRFYLGMHSPLDVFVGAIMSAGILSLWFSFHKNLEDFIIHGENVISFWATMAVLCLFAYPTPERSTPSFEFHTAFNGVSFGIVVAMQRTYALYHHDAIEPLSFTTLTGLKSVILRVLIGLPVILGVKSLSKKLAVRMLPSICNLLGLQIRSSGYVKAMLVEDISLKEIKMADVEKSEKISGGKPGYLLKFINILEDEVLDVDTGIRALQYAGLGWSVMELVPHIFNYLNV